MSSSGLQFETRLRAGQTILTSRELVWCYACIWDVKRFNIEFYGADSHFRHSAYVTWSHVEFWSAHAPARFSHFCCRTHFVRRDQCVDCSRALDTLVTLQPLILAFLLRIPCVLRCAAPPYYLRSHIYHRFKTKTFQAWDSHTLSKEHLSLCTP